MINGTGASDFFGSRQAPAQDKIDWGEVNQRDEQRRDATRKLLAEGKLQSGKDYHFAAYVFQHSHDSDNDLLAHVLAMTAVSKGEPKVRWLAAATMDRYLWSVNQPQIFSTQFHQTDRVWNQDPYHRSVISDAVRASSCVASLAAQEEILANVRAGKTFRSTQVTDCR
jgi:hypothetical protein